MPALAVERLGKQFGEAWALEDVSFVLEPGQILGLMGPNGAGKSTLLRILSTLERPTSGTFQVGELDPRSQEASVRRMIGFMPETIALYDELTVREYLDFFGRLLGYRGADRHRVVTDVMEITDLTRLAGSMISILSKGVRQRIYVAKTLLSNPGVLLLDEPSSGLDPRARLEFSALVLEFARQGKAVVVSSHILSELEGTVTHLAVLEKGRLKFFGARPGLLSEVHEVAIELLEDASRLLTHLEGRPGVEGATLAERRVEFTFRGSSGSVAELHREVLDRGFPVYSFAVRKRGLEDLYMELTRGEIS